MPTTYEFILFREMPNWFKTRKLHGTSDQIKLILQTDFFTTTFGPAIQKGINLGPDGIKNSNNYYKDAPGVLIKYFNLWHPVDYLSYHLERLFDMIEADPDVISWYEYWEGVE